MNLKNANILWVESRSYLPDYFLPKHTHTFFHYIYVVGGTGMIKIANRDYKLVPNHLYPIAPDTEHSFYADSYAKLVTKEIKFSILDEQLKEIAMDLPFIINCNNIPVYDIFNKIHNECITKKSWYKEISSSLLAEALLHIKRSLGSDRFKPLTDSSIDTKNIEDDIEKVKIYIKENIDNNITLQELSDISNL